MRGCESDKDTSGARAVIDKRVRNASRSEDRITWAQPKPLVADFDDVFSGEAIEPLVLFFVVVLVRTGPAPLDRLLCHEQRTTAVLGCDLDVNEVAAGQFDDVVRPTGPAATFMTGGPDV